MFTSLIDFENDDNTTVAINTNTTKKSPGEYLKTLKIDDFILDTSVTLADKLAFIQQMTVEEKTFMVNYLCSMVGTTPLDAVISLAKALLTKVDFEGQYDIIKCLFEHYNDDSSTTEQSSPKTQERSSKAEDDDAKKDVDWCYEQMYNIYKANREEKKYHFLIKTDLLLKLCEIKTYQTDVLKFLNEISFEAAIDCQYRYKFICALLRNEKILPVYSTATLLTFVETGIPSLSPSTTTIRNKNDEKDQKGGIPPEIIIMGMINIINDKKFTKDVKLKIITSAKKLLVQTKVPYNVKAEISDMLLMDEVKTLDPECEELASDTLLELGESETIGRLITVYDNKENVHNVSINQSIRGYLRTMCNEDTNPLRLTFAEVKAQVLTYSKTRALTDKQRTKINSSLFRIEVDKFLYENQYMKNIFIRIYQLIEKEKDETVRNTLMQRTIEELIDMCKTCSSGHVLRIVNIVSGIYFHMRLGFKEQIEANLTQKLNKIIQNEMNKDDPDAEYDVIDEMTLPADQRKQMNKIIIKKLPKIKEGMFKEFVGDGHLSEDLFEEYFVGAYQHYMQL